MNPSAPESAEYFDPELVAYVMRKPERTRPTRVLTSFGDLGEDWAIGTTHVLYHDQTNAGLGTYTVVGIADFSTGRKTGEVPDRQLSHAVFK
jgi:hypothetical protein